MFFIVVDFLGLSIRETHHSNTVFTDWLEYDRKTVSRFGFARNVIHNNMRFSVPTGEDVGWCTYRLPSFIPSMMTKLVLEGTMMAKKKLKRRKPKPQPEPEAKKDSDQSMSKRKIARLYHENEKWFPVSESVASSKEFTKIKGRLTKTKRVSRGG